MPPLDAPRRFVLAALVPTFVVGVPGSAPGQVPETEFAFVAGGDAQPGGPAHDFRISTFEIGNDQFAAFLNDALDNLGNERGAYMYFDIDSGDVYIHSNTAGTTGTEGAGTLIFDASVNGWIEYDPEATPTPGYVLIDEDYEAHPVTGVTWYGAVKFCNWMTIDSGLPASERCYLEAPNTNLNGWRPVTSPDDATWATRDLNDAEREALLGKLGFRLPMDDGEDTASLYNEWYKAAAWDETAGVNHDYGFGRDAIDDADANYTGSGDPFEAGTTPVGFYDGTLYNPGGGGPVGGGTEFQTGADENSYGLYDTSGNVWEWMQDQGTGITDRRNRGGSWRSSAPFLASSLSAPRDADSASDSTGFRVVRSASEALLVIPMEEFTNSGPWGGPYDYPDTSVVYQVTNLADEAVDFDVNADVDWVEVVDGSAGGGIEGGETIDVTVTLDPICVNPGGMTIGENVATVTFDNLTDATSLDRLVRLTVTEPLDLTPAGDIYWSIRYGEGAPDAEVYTLESESDLSVDWSAVWIDTSMDPEGNPNWLTIDGTDWSAGSILAPETVEVSIALDVEPEGVSLDLGTYLADVVFTDECTSTEFVREVTLDVDPWFTVEPVNSVEFTGAFGGPFDPPTHVFTLTNLTAEEIPWSVTYDPPLPSWLMLDAENGTIPPLGLVEVTTAITAEADDEPVGEYPVTIAFTQPDNGFAVERTVTLIVTELQVTPLDDPTFSGPLGGLFQPAESVYTIHNAGLAEMEWSAIFLPDLGDGWDESALDLMPSLGIILDPEGTADVTVSPTLVAETLETGIYTGDIQFNNDTTGATTSRSVTLIVGGEAFALSMVNVPGDHEQPGGPDHLFRIGTFEVSNVEYARFLNNARLNPGNARGAYMYFDTGTGDVYINDQQQGAQGPSPPANPMLYEATDGRIQLEEGTYAVEEGFGDYPVGGVSWYGAVKFCNWLTIVQGMDPAQRAYTEGTTAATWVPAATNADLVANYSGFRLPMDDGTPTQSLYNEWYKASAWDETSGLNHDYGFGRDALANVDANYLASDDPFEVGPSPVGYYDGVNTLDGGADMTVDTDNVYGLYDLCGNVAEWVHDEGDTGNERGLRGGNYQNPVGSPLLRTDARGSLPAPATEPFIGFRVAQSYTPADLIIAQDNDDVRADGFAGGPYCAIGRAECEHTFTFQLYNPGNYTIDDLTVAVDQSWLEFVGLPPAQIPPTPASPLVIELQLTDEALTLGPSPGPPGSRALVLSGDPEIDPQTPAHDFYQPDGPFHDFWIGTTEVVNIEFLSFLADTYSLASSETDDHRSAYMYFDTDTGNVYINDQELGQTGTGAPAGNVILLYDASIGRIGFTDGEYAVEEGYENHPTVGVTWYGAVKYCNWLTLVTSLPWEMRAYGETVSSDPAGWCPVTATNWGNGLFSAAERDDWVRRTLGYRLPMDGLAPSANMHNEWYKASAWDYAYGVSRDFGFGRDTLGNADANYQNSGDTELDGTTSAAFFDGVHTLYDGETTTTDTANAYGLYDLCGNVAEWMNDVFADGDGTQRSIRGGSWRDVEASDLLRNIGRSALGSTVADDATGFRVVRGTGHLATITITDNVSDKIYRALVVLDLREPLQVTPRTELTKAGVYGVLEPGEYTGFAECLGGPGEDTPPDGCAPDAFHQADWDYDGDVDLVDFARLQVGSLELCEVYTLTNLSDSDMAWRATVNKSWVELADLDSGGPVASEIQGTLAGGVGATVMVEVRTNAEVRALGAGEHAAVVTFTNETTGQAQTREVAFVVGDPIEVLANNLDEPEYTGYFGGPFVPTGADPSFTLSSRVAFDLDCTVSSGATWLPIDDSSWPLSGTITPTTPLTFEVGINDEADALPVGTHDGLLTFAWSDPSHGGAAGEILQTIRLIVDEPITIDQPFDPWEVVPDDPAPFQVYTLENHHAVEVITVLVDIDVDWLDMDDDAPVVSPGASNAVPVTVSLNDNVSGLSPGEYPATITFTDSLTAQEQTRSVILTVGVGGELSVLPTQDFAAQGRQGGPYTPASLEYTLTHVPGAGTMLWSATFDPVQPAWLMLSEYGGELEPDESTTVTISIGAEEADLLGAGVYPTTPTDLIFQALGGDPISRTVSLTIVDTLITMEEQSTEGVPDQPAGPTYEFAIGTFHVTNAEFVVFLNDAKANPTNGRGEYMFFHDVTDGGDVYVNTVAEGGAGSDPGSRTLKMFAPFVAGHIEYVGGAYQVVPGSGFENHPVTGVSWYGAVKYCNWLSIDQGFPLNERCYTEAVDATPNGWHPVTISTTNWADRDLNDAERLELVSEYRGYRLPMDQGYNNSDVSSDSADTYNEWYMAAAWNGTATTVFGFGRDAITGADANYKDSGDPFDNGTAPVGYYDGTDHGGVFGTTDTDNAYGLYDMSGNAYQWLQGRFNTHAQSINFRTMRGGSWNKLATGAQGLEATTRTYALPSLTNSEIGFRVVRTEP